MTLQEFNHYLDTVSQSHGWFGTSLVAVLVVAIALLVHAIGAAIMRRISVRSLFLAALVTRIHKPSRLALIFFALEFSWRLAPDSVEAIETVRRLNTVCLITSLTWLIVAWVLALSDTVIARNPVNVADNLHARRILTQTRVLSRSVIFLVALMGVSFALLTLPGARQLGASILASAGVAGVVAGMAARPVLGNFIAGLQLAFTQPIRIDDVIIVEGEWGRVEEITGSYVVVAIWDERRLIVPLQWFIEHPFQNWTRSTTQLLGSVMLWVDYRAPVSRLRAELERCCREDPAWDGRVCGLQVTDADARTMQIRLLVSSADSSKNFDLRCRMREALIDFMQREIPDALPVTRLEMHAEAADTLPSRASNEPVPAH